MRPYQKGKRKKMAWRKWNRWTWSLAGLEYSISMIIADVSEKIQWERPKKKLMGTALSLFFATTLQSTDSSRFVKTCSQR